MSAEKTCNCRWDGDTQVQQCTLHQAHVDAIHEWADRARGAEAERDALAAKLAELEGQDPVAWVEVVSTHEGPYNFEGMALLGKGNHLLYARPVPAEMSPEFTDTARSALLWVLWHHQGGSSPVGQPIRYALGMDAHERLSEHQVQEAKRWAALTKSESTDFRQARTAPPEPVNARLLDALKRAKNSIVAFKFVPGGANCWEASDEENLTAVNSAIAAAEAAHTEPVNVDFGKRGENMFFKIDNQSFLLEYKPEEQGEFEFMKAMLLSAFSRITHGVKTAHEPVNARLLEALKRCRFDSLNMSLADLEFCRSAIAAAEAQQERLLQDMHDAGREIDRVMAEAAPKAPQVDFEAIARAIWNVRREGEDRCDMELEDLGTDHSVWEEASEVASILEDAGIEVAE